MHLNNTHRVCLIMVNRFITMFSSWLSPQAFIHPDTTHTFFFYMFIKRGKPFCLNQQITNDWEIFWGKYKNILVCTWEISVNFVQEDFKIVHLDFYHEWAWPKWLMRPEQCIFISLKQFSFLLRNSAGVVDAGTIYINVEMPSALCLLLSPQP